MRNKSTIEMHYRDAIPTELNMVFLQSIIAAFNAGDAEKITSIGLDIETVERLRKLNLEELKELSSQSTPLFTPVISDSINLSHLIEVTKQKSSRKELALQLIQRKAPVNMMRDLAGVNWDKVKIYQTMFKVELKHGKPAKLDMSQEHDIYLSWIKHMHLDFMERCLAVGNDTRIFLDRSWYYMKDLISRESEIQSRNKTNISAKYQN